MGAWEIFLGSTKMPCKSVFLLQIKYIEKLKLLWQLKIGGRGESKIILLRNERKQRGGGGSFQKKFKKVGTNQNKKSTRNLKVGAFSFHFIIMIQSVF